MTIGPQQKQVSPLPAGRYWLDIFGPDNVADWPVWVREMHGGVRVEHVQESPARLCVIFVVPEGRAPFFPAEKFGYPTIVGPDVKECPEFYVREAQPGLFESMSNAFSTGLGGVGLLLLLAFMSAKK